MKELPAANFVPIVMRSGPIVGNCAVIGATFAETFGIFVETGATHAGADLLHAGIADLFIDSV